MRALTDAGSSNTHPQYSSKHVGMGAGTCLPAPAVHIKAPLAPSEKSWPLVALPVGSGVGVGVGVGGGGVVVVAWGGERAKGQGRMTTGMTRMWVRVQEVSPRVMHMNHIQTELTRGPPIHPPILGTMTYKKARANRRSSTPAVRRISANRAGASCRTCKSGGSMSLQANTQTHTRKHKQRVTTTARGN